MGRDTGYWGGDLRSLAGVLSARGYGLDSKMIYASLGSGEVALILGANPNRVAALLSSDLEPIVWQLEDNLIAMDYPKLNPGQWLQIDQNFPWTGVIVVKNLGAATHIMGYELSVAVPSLKTPLFTKGVE